MSVYKLTWGENDPNPNNQGLVYIEAPDRSHARDFVRLMYNSMATNKKAALTCEDIPFGDVQALYDQGKVIKTTDKRHPWHIDSLTRPPILPVFSVHLWAAGAPVVNVSNAVDLGHIAYEVNNPSDALRYALDFFGVTKDQAKHRVVSWDDDDCEMWVKKKARQIAPRIMLIKRSDPRHPEYKKDPTDNGVVSRLELSPLGRGFLSVLRQRLGDDTVIGAFPAHELVRHVLLSYDITLDPEIVTELVRLVFGYGGDGRHMVINPVAMADTMTLTSITDYDKTDPLALAEITLQTTQRFADLLIYFLDYQDGNSDRLPVMILPFDPTVPHRAGLYSDVRENTTVAFRETRNDPRDTSWEFHMSLVADTLKTLNRLTNKGLTQ